MTTQWPQQPGQPYGLPPQSGSQFPPAYPQGGYPGDFYSAATPQLAHWGLRVGASLLDSLIGGGAFIVLLIVALASANWGTDAFGDTTMSFTVTSTVAIVFAYASILGMWIWNRVLLQGRTGQSIGKRALKIRLVSATTGQPVGAGLALGREVAHIVDSPLDLGYLWPLWDAKKQTFADKICGTVVVCS